MAAGVTERRIALHLRQELAERRLAGQLLDLLLRLDHLHRLGGGRGAMPVSRPDLGELRHAQVFKREHAEDIVDHAGRELDVRMPLDHPLRLEPREGERVHELLQRHAVLQAQTHRDRERVHQRPERGALFVHVDKDLAQRPILVLAGAQVHLVPADPAFERDPAPLLGQASAGRDLGRFLLFAGILQMCRQRLGRLRSIAIDRNALQAQLPRQQVRVADVLLRHVVGHIDRLGNRAGDERLRGGDHPDLRLPAQEALAVRTAPVRTVEHRIVLRPQMRRAFNRLPSAHVARRRFDLLRREPEREKKVEVLRVVGLRSNAQPP